MKRNMDYNLVYFCMIVAKLCVAVEREARKATPTPGNGLRLGSCVEACDMRCSVFRQAIGHYLSASAECLQ